MRGWRFFDILDKLLLICCLKTGTDNLRIAVKGDCILQSEEYTIPGYTIERAFLGKFSMEELVRRIIISHIEDTEKGCTGQGCTGQGEHQ